MNDTPTVWIDILSDPAVRLAARAWHKDLPETWGILSRAIKAEQLSQYMPLTQFDEYIALFTPKPARTTDEISPPTKPRQPIPLAPSPPIVQSGQLGKAESPKDSQGLWLMDYKEHLERSAEREKNAPPPKKETDSHWLSIVAFILLFLYINDKLWHDTIIPEESGIYILISLFATLLAFSLLSSILQLITSLFNRKSRQ